MKLLNEAREKTELYIDRLHAPFIGTKKKPRTYRIEARKRYLTISKQRRPGKGKIRKAIDQQLRFLKRNLNHIDELLESGSSLIQLSKYEQQYLQVIYTLYAQQLSMYKTNTQRIRPNCEYNPASYPPDC